MSDDNNKSKFVFKGNSAQQARWIVRKIEADEGITDKVWSLVNHCARGPADTIIGIEEALPVDMPDDERWEHVKERFLDSYAPEVRRSDIIARMERMTPRTSQNPREYFDSVIRILRSAGANFNYTVSEAEAFLLKKVDLGTYNAAKTSVDHHYFNKEYQLSDDGVGYMMDIRNELYSTWQMLREAGTGDALWRRYQPRNGQGYRSQRFNNDRRRGRDDDGERDRGRHKRQRRDDRKHSDWNCPHCGFKNYGSRRSNTCYKCKKNRNDGKSSGSGDNNKGFDRFAKQVTGAISMMADKIQSIEENVAKPNERDD